MQSSIKLLVGLLLASQCFFVFAQSAQDLAEAILDSQRPAQDKERDENRKAPEILEFMGVGSKCMLVTSVTSGSKKAVTILSQLFGNMLKF